MPLSPICLVSDNGGPYVPTTGGVDVLPNDPVQIKLQSPSGVGIWYLIILGTDELTSPPTLTNVNPGTGQVTSPTSIVSFTYPGLPAGRSIIFQSTVVSGPNTAQTTFGIYTRTPNGDRVGAVGETREGNVSFGWAALLNPIMRQGAGYLFYDDSIALPHTGSSNIQGALDYLKTHGGGLGFEEGGVPIAGGPHTILNVTGSGGTIADAGGGVANLNLTGGGSPPWVTTLLNLTLTQAKENWILLDTDTGGQGYTPLNLTFPTGAQDGDIVVVKWYRVGFDPGGAPIFANLLAAAGDRIEDPNERGNVGPTIPLLWQPQAIHYKYNLADTTWYASASFPVLDIPKGVASFNSPYQLKVPTNLTVFVDTTAGPVVLRTPTNGQSVDEWSFEWSTGSNSLTLDPSGTGFSLEDPSAAPGTYAPTNAPVTVTTQGFYTYVLNGNIGGWSLKIRPASPASPVGDNADARRMGPERAFLGGGQFGALPARPLLPQITDEGIVPSAGDLVLSERKLLFTGAVSLSPFSTTTIGTFTPAAIGPTTAVCNVTSGAGLYRGASISITQAAPPLNGTFLINDIDKSVTPNVVTLYTTTISGGGSFNPGATVNLGGQTLQGQLISTETSGFSTNTEFSFPGIQPLFTNALSSAWSLTGLSVYRNEFNTIAVTTSGLITNYIFESVIAQGSDFNLAIDSGAENWSFGQAIYVYQDAQNGFGQVAEIYWTVPNGLPSPKIYQANILGNVGDPTFQMFPGDIPFAICATGNNTFWVNFITSGKLRQFKVVPNQVAVPTFVQVGPDVQAVPLTRMIFDGKYIWGITSTGGGGNGTIYKYDQTGALVDSFGLTRAPAGAAIDLTSSRMCFDGDAIWITASRYVIKVFPEGSAGGTMGLMYIDAGSGNQARGICADRDGTIWVAVLSASIINIQAIFPTTNAFPDVREPRPIVWQLNTFGMPGTWPNAITIPPQSYTGQDTRMFVLDIVASSGGGGAAWRKAFAAFDNGLSISIQGSIADVIPPRMFGTAISGGWSVTISDNGGTFISAAISQGTTAISSTLWTLKLTEIHSYAGQL